MKTKWLLPLTLFLLTVAVFSAAHSFGPAMCDDYQYVVTNDKVSGGLTISGLKYAFTDVQ